MQIRKNDCRINADEAARGKRGEKAPLVYVIIVNYNGLRWLDDCLRTLAATRYDNFKILFVDNNSSDNSVEFVEKNFPAIEIIVNRSNLGFCEGNNVGIAAALDAKADYVVLLNSDTKVAASWLAEIVAAGEANEKIGVLGAVQLVYDSNEFNSWTLDALKKHLPEIGDAATARLWIPIKWVEGSCFAIKRRVVEQVGMLDPIYFMYCEEIDYCRRAAAHDFEVALVPRSRYHHFRGGSSGVAKRDQFVRGWRYQRSRLIYHATDLTLSFNRNVRHYLAKTSEIIAGSVRERRFEKALIIVCLQIEILRHALPIVRKWKNDRALLKKHASV